MTDRMRTFAWGDPMETATAARTAAGLDVLRAVAAGELPGPPIADTLGFDLIEVEPGRVVFAFEPAEYHYNPIGSVHGGVYATLLDSATGCAVHSMLPAGVGYTSLDLTVKFLRAITLDTGRVTCVGTVTHLGGRTALAEARLLDADERLLGTASSSILVIRPQPGTQVG
ncbi:MULTISPECIES: PaaI family thioesterase [unclassified Modestobacter]|uniref:PaaI family thioesterase n=1 Tax=unclassified Modestobacter TaxID=2643866 RepID=UPI0022AB24E9|nr:MULTISPECIES: PaaI family thioesterase [unclassified Modestobacter]MCZ2822897.1 PaaI family thioesterase [Modestobacter sp. VKM Ac-2981]MCZ2851143.1 PaaI family thioesterase [Modestobacter sp. VKM Ac-2982]